MNHQSQIIFITSEMRSGSTFLSYMLGTHAQSAHLGEFRRPWRLGAVSSCRLCEAKGYETCEILGDLTQVLPMEAHRHALTCFEKYGVTTLIDASKNMDWIEEVIRHYIVHHTDIACKIIHLVREPRGWISSERRRQTTMSIQSGVDRWKKHFYSTSERIQAMEVECMRITYEEILLYPQQALTRLSQLIGFPQHPGQYQYWTKEHHGFGGNGAAFNNLGRFSDTACETGDDAFYSKNRAKTFYDFRWNQEADSDALNQLIYDRSIQGILSICGITFEEIEAALKGSPAIYN